MNRLTSEILIVGGGPAGLSAAVGGIRTTSRESDHDRR